MKILSKFLKNKESRYYPFVFGKALNMLSKNLTKKILWEVPDKEIEPDSSLFRFWHNISGAHKWHHYFSIYEKIFHQYRDQSVKILEIGVAQGASIKMWRNYFNNNTKIVGIDVHPSCTQFESIDDNIFIRIGSQADEVFLKSLVEEFGVFDIIIDDGSHMTSHMIASFNFLFLNGLNSNGIYFAEDTHSNYWLSHRNTAVSFVELTKTLIDIMHYHYTISKQEVEYRLRSAKRIKVFEVPQLATLIEEIRFFDSIVVIYKNSDLTIPVSEYID